MKTDRFDPPRAEEQGPDALRELIRERRRGPSAESANAISARVAARVAASASGTGARAESVHASYKLPALVVVAAGGLLLAPMVARTFASGPSSAPVALAAPDSTQDTIPSRPPSAFQGEPLVSVDELPTAAAPPTATVMAAPPAATGRARVPASTAKPNMIAGSVPTASELDITRRAQEALAADPSLALARADELARLFPNGEFVQERETIAVEALARLGRREEALQRGRQLLRRFPRTPYAARLEKLVGEPLTATAPPSSSDRTDSSGASTR